MPYPIASYKVCDITSRELQLYLNRLSEDGYSQSTIKKQYNLIAAYWKWAMSQGLVEVPIYFGASVPAPRGGQANVKVYSHLEQHKLMGRLLRLDKRQYGVVILMLEIGLRIGEALALTWDDVLWDKKAIHIHRTLVRMSSNAKTYIQDSPKSKTSDRVIPLSRTALEVLEELRGGSETEGLIFAKEDDPTMPYSYSSVEYHVKRFCKELCLPYLGLHAFRHTFASNCYARGCNVKLLSKLLGHADCTVTYNTYIHLFGDELEEMRKVLG